MEHKQQGGLNLADRLRRELNRASGSYTSSNTANGVSCTTECRFLPGYTGRSQAELDALAREMTNQIIYDIRSGKLERGQINTPNWFENRVADKLSELQLQHRSEFERNVQSVANRFHQNHEQQFAIQSQQQQQQQQQHHQTNQFQQQSQSQQTYGFIPPISTGNTYQRVVEQHHKEVNRNAVYPPPVTVFHGASILHRNNCTDQIHQGATFPYFNVQNQYNQRVESNRQVNSGPTFITPIGGDSSYHVSQTIEHKEHRVPPVPIVIPSQNTYTHQYQEEQREIQRQQPRPQIYGINQQNHSSHVETSRTHNVQIITPAPSPVITRQDIYDHFYESDSVPNYRPRVTIDKNTKFHELEVRNRHQVYQPAVIPVTASTHIEKEEEQIERQFHQKPVIQPQISTSVTTNEEVQIDRQVTQRPYIYPQQNTITRTEDVQTVQKINRPQYPVFSHTSSVQRFNESRQTNQNTHTIVQQPSGHTVTTIKETHYVNVLPQPANQYSTVQYSEQEYLERLNRIQHELQRLGYGTLSEEEYNATILSGGFIHNGYKYLYNADRGYEKTDRTEITEEEYHSLLRGLQNQLQQIGVQMTEREYNQTIENGFFAQNGVRYVYDSETGSYHRQDITDEQYEVLRQRIQDESNRYGWSLTTHEINQTIATGALIINGHHYTLDKQSGVLVEDHEVQISEQEYRTILRRLQEQLHQLGFEQMTESEYNRTINSGYFVRGGQKYRYNADYGRYEKVEITDEEYKLIVRKLKETLQHLNYRQMNEREMNDTIATGKFIRGGYQWTYSTESGDANAIRIASQFEELSETEYESIYRHLQALLKSLGYARMSEIEIKTTIISGSFSRGGNQWVYQPASGEFERIELSENEYNYRIGRLIEILTKLGIEKSTTEQREIIYRGNFYYAGHRYEYDTSSGTFIQMQMTEEEYQERKRQLLEQLIKIGYGTMTDSECRATINSGIFYYGGHEWVYNYLSGLYEIGRASDKENGIVDDNYFNNIGYDNTQYGTSKTTDQTSKPNAFDIDKVDQNTRPIETISKNRGDQPPQTFAADYEESEEVTERVPAPIKVPPVVSPPRPPITTPTPIVVSTAASDYDYNRRFESQRIVYSAPPPEAEYEQRYHHKKTTYTQTSGYVSSIHCNEYENICKLNVFGLFFAGSSQSRDSQSLTQIGIHWHRNRIERS